MTRRTRGRGRRRTRVAAGTATLVLLLCAAFAAAGRVGHAATDVLGRKGEPVTAGSRPFAARVFPHGYRLLLRVTPNRATVAAAASLLLTRQGKPVSGARVRLTYTMLGMGTAGVVRSLSQTAGGRYTGRGPVLGMSGRWILRVDVAPPRAAPFTVRLIDVVRP